MKVSVPGSPVAEVHIPVRNATLDSGGRLESGDGVLSVMRNGTGIIVVVGSGDYAFFF